MSDKPIAPLTPAIYSWNLAHAQVCANLAGYALSVHGSMNRDFDLIAVPWVEDVHSPDELVDIMCQGLELTMQEGDPLEKPHGRLAYTLLMDGGRFIDLSVMPRQKNGISDRLKEAGFEPHGKKAILP